MKRIIFSMIMLAAVLARAEENTLAQCLNLSEGDNIVLDGVDLKGEPCNIKLVMTDSRALALTVSSTTLFDLLFISADQNMGNCDKLKSGFTHVFDRNSYHGREKTPYSIFIQNEGNQINEMSITRKNSFISKSKLTCKAVDGVPN